MQKEKENKKVKKKDEHVSSFKFKPFKKVQSTASQKFTTIFIIYKTLRHLFS